MPLAPRRLLGLVVTLGLGVAALAGPAAATVDRGSPVKFTGTFEFTGLASDKVSKGCQGQGAFGVMKPGAKVTISERDAAGDFEVLATGKVAKGKIVKVDGENVCRMKLSAKAPTTPADDSRIYLEIKDVAFDISWPATDVASGDLGIWTCEYDDNSCASVVGRD